MSSPHKSWRNKSPVYLVCLASLVHLVSELRHEINKTHEINQMNYTNQDSFNILLDNLLIGEL